MNAHPRSYDLGPALFVAGTRPRIAGRMRKPTQRPGLGHAAIALASAAALWLGGQALGVLRDVTRPDSGLAMLLVGFVLGIGWGLQIYQLWAQAVGR